MPRHTARRRPRRHRMHHLARLHMRDLDARALVTSTYHIASIPAETDCPHGTHTARQRALANPVRGIPEADEGVRAACGEVAAGRGQGERVGGRGVRVQGVQGGEGGVGGDFDGAVAGGEEDAGGWGGVREKGLVGLERLWVRTEGSIGWERYGEEGVVLFGGDGLVDGCKVGEVGVYRLGRRQGFTV